MADKWASLVPISSTDDNTACAWAGQSEAIATDKGSANKWANVGASNSAGASSWAALAVCDDDTDDEADQQTLCVAGAAPTAPANDIVALINSMTPTTTLATLQTITSHIVVLLQSANTDIEIGNCVMLFERTLSKLSECGNSNGFIEDHLDDANVEQFCKEQLTSLTGQAIRPLESGTAEANRIGIKTWKLHRKRSIMSVGTIASQRSCANAFLSLLCDRVEAVGGQSLTYFEKHRGDETPHLHGQVLMLSLVTPSTSPP